jgi:hypothetical protein
LWVCITKAGASVFDEASAIPDLIWETTEGALTVEQTEILWLVCGNPTRNKAASGNALAAIVTDG